MLAVLGCLLYYAPWDDGMFSLLGLFCVTWTSEECRLTQEMDLKNSLIPAYTPIVWLLGVAAAPCDPRSNSIPLVAILHGGRNGRALLFRQTRGRRSDERLGVTAVKPPILG